MGGAKGVAPVTVAVEAQAFLQALIGRPARERAIARDAVTTSAIRTWCDAMGERNPVYLDRDAALAAGHADVVAPPAMLHVWTMPGLEPDRPLSAGPARAGDLDESVRARLAEMGYAGTLAASIDQEFMSVVHRGDRLLAQDEYIAVSGEKRTRLGRGFFVTSRTTYSRDDGAIVGRLSTTVFHFAPTSAVELLPPLPPPAKAPDRPRPAVPMRLAAGGQAEVVVVPVTPTQIVSGALATRDFYPVHHDRDFARAHGNRDFLMNSLTTNGLLARIVGEWTCQAPLVRLVTRLVAPAYTHDELRMTGEVCGAGPGWAELTVRAELTHGVHAEATARVSTGPA
jgi:acyl dehydratase